jgi:hypothetical protein
MLLASLTRMWRIVPGGRFRLEGGGMGVLGMWRSYLCLVLRGFLKYTRSIKFLVRALPKVIFHILAAWPASLPIVINPS